MANTKEIEDVCKEPFALDILFPDSTGSIRGLSAEPGVFLPFPSTLKVVILALFYLYEIQYMNILEESCILEGTKSMGAPTI